jgi:membrane protein implicated in regulation of membrane protease activity
MTLRRVRDVVSPSDNAPRRGTPDRMSYALEWIGDVVVFGIVLLLLIVPWFAAIAVVVATIAVLLVALAAGLVALAAAAQASPYLLVRSVRGRLRPMKNTMDLLAERDPESIGRRIACGSWAGRA